MNNKNSGTLPLLIERLSHAITNHEMLFLNFGRLWYNFQPNDNYGHLIRPDWSEKYLQYHCLLTAKI